MILKNIQRQLEQIYQFRLPFAVEDFFQKAGPIERRELLLIQEKGGHLELGLFLEPQILQQLRRQNPYQKLDRKNLENFSIAVEGVSHFLYLAKRALADHPVSQLELEIQAEVDKYLSAAEIFYQRSHGVPDFLFSTLFETCSVAPSLPPDEKNRYRTANRFATKFCAHLSQKIRVGRWRDVLEKARHFYFLDHWSKLAALTP